MKLIRTMLGAVLLAAASSPSLAAQNVQSSEALEAARLVATVEARPASLALTMGETLPFELVALDAQGNRLPVSFRVSGRGGIEVVGDDDRQVRGERGGEATLIATVVTPEDFEGEVPRLAIPVTVAWPPIEHIEVEQVTDERLYAGTSVPFAAAALHADGSERPAPEFSWSSSDPSVATVDAGGMVTAHRAGTTQLVAQAEGSRGLHTLEVAPFPATSLELRGGASSALTGDVLRFEAVATDAGGRRITDIPLVWSTSFVPDDSIHAPGAAGLVDGGGFVGDTPGRYQVIVSAGDLTARSAVDVRPRDVVRDVEILGQGEVSNVHTSDLWVYTGNDGRDYAVTGTWGADGWAYFWDVTDPTNPFKTDSIQVDARTVNDVKVSPDARYAALSREGASVRRNGPVILDLADPAHPVVASHFDDQITGGVHNMFATEDYLFALSGGDKYVIIDVRDLRNPTFVSEYNHPDSRIHDVWVYDGIAYSSEWGTGVVVVDVGNGRWGGTIENPVFVTNVPYPVGRTHAAFPYYQEETGKVYLFLGDEIMPRPSHMAWSGAGLPRIPQEGGVPAATAGYVHIIDFTDPENPRDVARYEVPEFGTHNLWVEDDMLYVAYYEGGVRVVDVSGELMGNLAEQGREVAVFKAYDPDGFVANAPMAWGPQPHNGNLFFSDFNSGLWSIRLQPRGRPVS